MEIPTFVLVVIWFAVACVGVLAGVVAMALPSAFAWLRRMRRLPRLDSHHDLPLGERRRLDREALVLEGETLYLED